MGTFRYNNAEFDFDIDEYEDSERYNAAVRKLTSVPMPDRSVALHAYIQIYCNAIRSFFDTVLGNGAAEMILSDSRNKRIHDEAYSAFLLFVDEQARESNKRVENALAKYAPGGGSV